MLTSSVVVPAAQIVSSPFVPVVALAAQEHRHRLTLWVAQGVVVVAVVGGVSSVCIVVVWCGGEGCGSGWHCADGVVIVISGGVSLLSMTLVVVGIVMVVASSLLHCGEGVAVAVMVVTVGCGGEGCGGGLHCVGGGVIIVGGAVWLSSAALVMVVRLWWSVLW